MLFPSDNEHFNSIKVRLNRVPARDGFADSRFQFHKGTIKPSIDKVPNRLHFHFNSIKVRLNPNVLAKFRLRALISIP